MSNLTLDDVLDDDVKEIYIFRKDNIPKCVLEKIGNETFTAVAVYRYSDGSWMNALMLYDQFYDNFEDTCDVMFKLYRDAIENKGISFIKDFNNPYSRMFVSENYHVYNFD